MGLDVYLYHIPDREEISRREILYETEKVKMIEVAGTGNDDLIKPKLKELADKFGLDEHGYSKTKNKIQEDSKLYPNHYFKVGYFRSSYNDSGIERVLFNLGLGNMDWIFQVTESGGVYEFSPDWELALERAENVLSEFRDSPALRIFQVRLGEFPGNNLPSTTDQAMEIFLREYNKAKNKKSGERSLGSFSSREGHFYLDEPLKVLGIIPGESDSFLSKGKIKTANVIYEVEDNTSYVEALEIVVETCKWVLNQKDPQNYYLHWSG